MAGEDDEAMLPSSMKSSATKPIDRCLFQLLPGLGTTATCPYAAGAALAREFPFLFRESVH